MSDQLLALANAPNQTLAPQLSVNSSALTLNLTLNYNAMAGYWQMSVSDVNGTSLVSCVPLVTGWYPAANLLAQYQYLNIGSAYLLNTGGSVNDYPGVADLNQFTLLWGDNV